MYAIGVKGAFVARHFLVGGDWGAENTDHSHYYEVEVELRGERLDEHGYLTDFVEVEGRMGEIIDRYRDALLNGLPEFAGLNPSVEHFARIFCKRLSSVLAPGRITGLSVKLWEKPGLWAAFREDLG